MVCVWEGGQETGDGEGAFLSFQDTERPTSACYVLFIFKLGSFKKVLLITFLKIECILIFLFTLS